MRMRWVMFLFPLVLLYGGCSSGSTDEDDDSATPTPCACTPTPTASPTAVPDTDGDGVLNDVDPDPNDSRVCGDEDLDTCDDCSGGSNDPVDDGPDLDDDGLCDAGDPDGDGDGVPATRDCDDADPAESPLFGYDRVDGIDNDCDGQIDHAVNAGIAAIRWDGASKNGALGTVVQGVGDLDGDGKADWVISEPNYGNNQGRVYVFFGQGNRNIKDGSAESLADAIFEGESDQAAAGKAVAVGDLNGDGRIDIAIGEPLFRKGPNYGHVAVFYGGDARLKGTVRLDKASFVVQGDAADLAVGNAIDMADLDGDGFDDLVLGAPQSDSGTGGVYVLFGSSSKISGTTDVSGIVTFVAGPVAGAAAGSAVAALGDLNHDGYDEVVVGAPNATLSSEHAEAGAIQVIYGRSSRVDLKAEVLLSGSATNEHAGAWALRAGDVDGSGHVAIAIGAPMNSGNTAGNGLLYLVVPTRGDVSSSLSSASFCEISGDLAGGGVGERATFSAPGDVDGDGIDDLLVGASGASSSTLVAAGIASLFYGGSNLSGAVSFSAGDAFWEGEQTQDKLGFSGTAGDIDLDGHADILLAAPAHDADKTENAGRAYLFFGY